MLSFRALSVLSVALLLFAGSAMAAMPVEPENNTGDTARVFPLTGDVLYDQTSTPAGNGAPDQAFEAAYVQYDSEVADDFDVTAAVGWDISGANTQGISAGGSLFVRVWFYPDAGGVPADTPSCAYDNVTSYTDVGGDLSITLPDVCNLDEGDYWFAQQVRQDFLAVGQHFFEGSTAQVGDESVWRNPANGFGLGCTDWAPAGTVCGVGGGFPDRAFQIVGKERTTGGGTPAVGPFGALLTVLALGAGSGYVLSRRRRA